LMWNYSLATFHIIVRQLCSYVNKGQAVWFSLEWLPAVCERWYSDLFESWKHTDNLGWLNKPGVNIVGCCQKVSHKMMNWKLMNRKILFKKFFCLSRSVGN